MRAVLLATQGVGHVPPRLPVAPGTALARRARLALGTAACTRVSGGPTHASASALRWVRVVAPSGHAASATRATLHCLAHADVHVSVMDVLGANA